MKAVILAGGRGTRLAEETSLRPKPMIEIGGRPLLWHIMKIYSAHGVNDFVICCGYRGYLIKEYFANYVLHMSDVTFDMAQNTMEVHQQHAEPWRVTLVDTGDDTLTGGRLKRVADYVRGRGRVLLHLRRRPVRRGYRGEHRVSPRARKAGDHHRRAAARPIRRPAAERPRSARLHREAER